MFDRLADKLLKQADKGKDLKKYNIDCVFINTELSAQ